MATAKDILTKDEIYKMVSISIIDGRSFKVKFPSMDEKYQDELHKRIDMVIDFTDGSIIVREGEESKYRAQFAVETSYLSGQYELTKKKVFEGKNLKGNYEIKDVVQHGPDARGLAVSIRNGEYRQGGWDLHRLEKYKLIEIYDTTTSIRVAPIRTVGRGYDNGSFIVVAPEPLFNEKPTISGRDEDLGNISDAISKTYTVFDEDDDKLSIVERLNNTVIGVHNNVESGISKTLIIPKEKIYELPIGKKNTISIEISDGQEKTYRNWTFTRTNTAPVIEVLTDTELGNMIKPFETKIKVSDPEHDKVKLIYTVNRIALDENESYTRIPIHTTEIEDIELDSELKYTIDKEAWDKLLIGDYELEIKAIDDQSGENKEIIKFSRTEDQIDFITSAIVKEVQPKQFISLWLINGSPKNIKIEACNNGLDDKPTWEDATTEAIDAVPYNFKNNTKTADEWAVMAKVYLDGKEGIK